MMDEWELLNTEDGLALQDAMYGISPKKASMNAADIHLKFPDEATATRLMLATGIWGQFIDEENLTLYFDASGYLTDVIGLIHKPSGNVLVDVGGWHINMRGELPELLSQYKITVSGTPYRIWD
jgi:hypothetical protein